MTFSQHAPETHSPHRHPIAAPLATAAARMPTSVMAGPSAVTLHGPIASSQEWRWETAGAGGTVQLSTMTPDTAGLVVTEESGSAAGVADALTVELHGALERTWAPPVPPSARVPMKRSRKIALAVVALLVPLLAVTGMRLLAPPKAMDVASAVDQFRRQAATPAATSTGQPTTAPKAASNNRKGGSNVGTPARNAGAAATSGAGAAQQPASAPAPSARGGQASGVEASTTAGGEQKRGSTQAEPAPRQQPASGPNGVPEEGVYRYATEGYESIDRPSSRHDYPSETALSVRHTDCGFTARWQPLENRWDEMDVCRRGNATFLPRVSTHREFYGQANDSNYDCGADNYAYRPEPGATWTGSCSDGPAKMQIRGKTLGVEPVRVGNETVETVHYSLQAQISGGDAEGSWVAERWVDPDTGILVRVEAQTNATSDSSVGEVHYHEELSLRLLSMTPQR